MKDPWTKPKAGRIEGGMGVGWRKVVAGKWRQLYLNNNKKTNKKPHPCPNLKNLCV